MENQCLSRSYSCVFCFFQSFLNGCQRSLSEIRWRRFPVVATAGLLVTVVEQSAHIRGIKRLIQLHREIGSDGGEFVVDAVFAAGFVNSDQVVLSAGAD